MPVAFSVPGLVAWCAAPHVRKGACLLRPVLLAPPVHSFQNRQAVRTTSSRPNKC